MAILRWASVLLSGALAGCGQVSPPEAPLDEAEARALLGELITFYRTLKEFEVRLETVISMAEEGKKVAQSLKQTLRLRRPDQYAIVSKDDHSFATLSAYLNGGKAALKLEGQIWIKADGIGSIEAMLKSPALGFDEAVQGHMVFDNNIALAFLHKLLFLEIGQGWEEDLVGLQHGGYATIGTTRAHQLILTTAVHQSGEPVEMDLKLWIQTGDQPFLLKLEPDTSKLFPQAEGRPTRRVTVVGEWSGWNTSPNFTPRDFTVPAPEENDPVFGSFHELMRAQMALEYPALNLVGTQAEDFTLPMLDGTEFTLSHQRGKRIVALIFWANRSSPRADTLLEFLRVKEALKGRAVSLVAVSLGEEADDVRAYLKKLGLDVPFILDLKEDLVPKYKVRSIPQTVVVGRDGQIKRIHLGEGEAFGVQLLEELKILLAQESARAAP